MSPMWLCHEFFWLQDFSSDAFWHNTRRRLDLLFLKIRRRITEDSMFVTRVKSLLLQLVFLYRRDVTGQRHLLILPLRAKTCLKFPQYTHTGDLTLNHTKYQRRTCVQCIKIQAKRLRKKKKRKKKDSVTGPVVSGAWCVTDFRH